MLKDGRKYEISIIRLFSFLCIIVCHIMQFYGMELMYWFNVGVQIFLFISGYLYGGKRELGNDFLNLRFKKMLVPYYIVIVIVGLVYFLFLPEYITVGTFSKALICYSVLPGGEHLWFVPTMLLCYIITPMIDILISNVQEDRHKWIKFICIVAVFIFLIFRIFTDYFNSAWITCYFLGYVIGRALSRNIFSELKTRVFFTLLALSNIIQIVIDYHLCIIFDGIEAEIYRAWCAYNHVWLAIFLFMWFRHLFSQINYEKVPKCIINILNLSDKYSYEAYLTHQYFILGPMSLMKVSEHLLINLAVVFCSIFVFTATLVLIERQFLKLTKYNW